jgi:glycosyltransferase involved in cell wall biosynthesis
VSGIHSAPLDEPDAASPRASGGLRVALLSPCFWPEVRRGMERFTRELADGLLNDGHQPRLITSHPGPPTRQIEDGLSIVRVPRPPQGRLLRRKYEPFLTHVPLSYGVLRAGHYDVAHAVHTTDALAATRWKRRTGRPAVLSFMGIPDRVGLRGARRRLELMGSAIRGCDAVVALSAYAGAAFQYWLGYEAPVIAPGVDLRAFKPAAARAARPTVVCSAAGEEPRKNVRLLVEAFKLLRQDIPESRLVLSQPRNIEPLRQMGIDVDAPGVEWHNLDDAESLARAYGEAWVAALPSQYEAFGLVLVEALACGTPVVGFDDAAIPEVIDRPGIGKLFSQLEPRALADALMDAMQLSSESGTLQRCRARAEDFSQDRFVANYVRLYRELGAARG